MADELVKLILETTGQQGVKALGDDVDKLTKELKELVTQWQQGALATDEFMKKTAATSGQLKQTQELLNGLTGKPGSGRNPGQGLLGASYAVQDFTSQLGTRGLVGALGAIQNNIPQILMSLGVGAGMTGVLSVAAVAVGALIPLLSKAFGSESQEQIEETKKRLEEFEAEAKKTAEAFKKLTLAPTNPEEEEAANFKAILEDRPKAQIVASAIGKAANRKSVEAELNPDEIKEIAEANKDDLPENMMPVTGWAEANRKRELAQQRKHNIYMAARQRIGQKAARDLGTAGPVGAEGRRRLMGLQPGELSEPIFRELAGVTKEVMGTSDAADAAFDEANEEWIRGKPKRQKARKRAVRQIEVREEVEKRIQSDTEHKNRAAEQQVMGQGRLRDEAKRDEADALRKELEAAKAMIHQAESMKGSKEHQEGMLRQQQIDSMRQMGMNESSIARQLQEWKQLNRDLQQIGRQLNRTAQSNGP